MTTTSTRTEAYNLLLKEIEAINLEAAHFLKTKGHTLPLFCKAEHLSSCFSWALSPQGHDYWEEIADQIPHGWMPGIEEFLP
jgi:hypothetical protein